MANTRKLIQVGVGGMGLGWTDRVMASERWEPAAYVDTNTDNLANAAKRHNISPDICFSSLEEALASVKADALLDVTPQQFRKGVCLAAFEKGLDVISEKPLADTLENAKAIIESARVHQRTYMVAQNYRYQPAAQTVRQNIHQIGAVGYVNMQFHKGPHFGGFREKMEYPLVLDMSIHHLDLMRCILGVDIVRIQAASINAPWNWNAGDATVMAQIEMENGICVNYAGSWVAQGWETPWNGNWRFDGEKGVLLWENDQISLSDKPDSKNSIDLIYYPKAHQAYLIDAFAEALDNGIEPETSGRRNLNSLASTYAVVMAAQQQRPVDINELLQ